jgi:hypothetical protein
MVDAYCGVSYSSGALPLLRPNGHLPPGGGGVNNQHFIFAELTLKLWGNIRADYALLGVSKDSAASHQKFAEKYSLPFLPIALSHAKLYSKFMFLIINEC